MDQSSFDREQVRVLQERNIKLEMEHKTLVAESNRVFVENQELRQRLDDVTERLNTLKVVVQRV